MSDLCAVCSQPIRLVDLHGQPFFTHVPRADCLTWWHMDPDRNNHQARPGVLRAGSA